MVGTGEASRQNVAKYRRYAQHPVQMLKRTGFSEGNKTDAQTQFR